MSNFTTPDKFKLLPDRNRSVTVRLSGGDFVRRSTKTKYGELLCHNFKSYYENNDRKIGIGKEIFECCKTLR
jgi:hypothetical protein